MDGARKALIIANDEYEDAALSRLRSPAHDAAALSRVLGDPAIGRFAVDVVRNRPSHVIQAGIEDLFIEAQPDDLLLLHFSCHGVKSESGELYFAATNTRPNRLGSTAVPADFVQRCMRASRSRSVVLFLDCCYGGAFSQGAAVRATGDIDVLGSFPNDRLGSPGRGRAVITASSSMEYAFEGDQLADERSPRPSVFTHALVQGLRTGDADLDEDGLVSLNELYEYLYDQVREANPNQTPGRNVESQGEIYLARSRRRRIRPAPLPADLREAITDGSLFARLGAIGELRTRLVSDNLGVARAAFDALEDMAAHDIQQVAAAARTALTDARPAAAPIRVDFGAVLQGSSAPEQRVDLLGPPIARAVALPATPAWLTARQEDDGVHLCLDTSLDTAAVGPLSCELTLEGPTGRVTVQVDAAVIAPPRTPVEQEPAPAEQEPAPAEQEPTPAAPDGSSGSPPPSGAGAAAADPAVTTIGTRGAQRRPVPGTGPSVRTSLVLTAVLGFTSCFAFGPGLVAIAYANSAQSHLRSGDLDAAGRQAGRARLWLWVALATWVALWIAEILIIVTSGANSSSSGGASPGP